MDDETRIRIEKMMDTAIRNLNRKDSSVAITRWFENDVLMEDVTLDWVITDAKETSSELTIGYIIGFLASSAYDIILDKKWRQEISKIGRSQDAKIAEADADKKQKTVVLQITKREREDVKKLIKPRIHIIRTEVCKAVNA
jgi:hypothetical protein